VAIWLKYHLRHCPPLLQSGPNNVTRRHATESSDCKMRARAAMPQTRNFDLLPGSKCSCRSLDRADGDKSPPGAMSSAPRQIGASQPRRFESTGSLLGVREWG
jgi:hypothetical protein